MDNDLIDALLEEDESSTLDFKRDQYQFEGAKEEKKSELLKDILAFANAWRRTDAHIVIGVEEVQGGRSIVVGVQKHLGESDLQQFVNAKTNRPIVFSYRGLMFEGKQIGVIQIPLQERPVYLRKDYGRLKMSTVYVRRGSSTAIADPDEIAKMGVSARASEVPLLDLQFADVQAQAQLGRSVRVESVLMKLPARSEIPLIGGDYFPLSMDSVNTQYYRDFAKHLWGTSLLRPVGFVLRNMGSTLARNCRLEIVRHKDENSVIIGESEYPADPQYHVSIADVAGLYRGLFEDDIAVTEHGDNWYISTELGDVQPKADIWSGIFYVGSMKPGSIDLEAAVYGDNLPDPLKVPLIITVATREDTMSIEELIDAADQYRQRD